MLHRILLLFFILAPSIASFAQITEIVILTKDEIMNLRELTGSNATAAMRRHKGTVTASSFWPKNT
jgi:hypothetical protein